MVGVRQYKVLLCSAEKNKANLVAFSAAITVAIPPPSTATEAAVPASCQRRRCCSSPLPFTAGGTSPPRWLPPHGIPAAVLVATAMHNVVATHPPPSRRVLGGRYASPICNGRSGSLSRMRLDDICWFSSSSCLFCSIFGLRKPQQQEDDTNQKLLLSASYQGGK